jgi:hypothetical protein
MRGRRIGQGYMCLFVGRPQAVRIPPGYAPHRLVITFPVPQSQGQNRERNNTPTYLRGPMPS